jgi:hypothetical protein
MNEKLVNELITQIEENRHLRNVASDLSVELSQEKEACRHNRDAVLELHTEINELKIALDKARKK